MATHPRQLAYVLAIYTVGRPYEFILIHRKQLLFLLFNGSKIQTTLTGGDMLRVVNLGLAQPPFSDQFYVSTTTWAWTVIEQFKSYTEVTPSGKGFHIIVQGSLPGSGKKNEKIEMYDQNRFFTMTGDSFPDFPHEPQERQDEIIALYRKHFPEKEIQPPRSVLPNNLADAELIEKARGAKNGDLFNMLWQGNWEDAGYPSQSEADQALSNLLAFWCGNDPERIDRFFRQSGLYREKWDKKHHGDGSTYGQKTIQRAVGSNREVYQPHERRARVEVSETQSQQLEEQTTTERPPS
jgi:putative DNA primase/helicase